MRTAIILSALLVSCCAAPASVQTATFDHGAWDQLLQKHVDNTGHVDYAGFRKDPLLTVYLKSLSAAKPSAAWPVNERKAFWINAYNAFTVQLIVDHPGVKSIKDIPEPWKTESITIGGQKMDLDHIENVELRKNLDDPRIHFAIVCASRSCPMLWDHAYTAIGLDKQLDEAARRFINDPARNVIKGDNVQLSKVFQWFKDDFTKGRTLIQFINEFAASPIPENATISFLEYDWGLNGK